MNELIIDCHTHPCFRSKLLKEVAQTNNIEFSTQGLLNDMKRNRVSKALAFASYLKEFYLPNEKVIELAEKEKKIIPIASLDHKSRDIGSIQELFRRKKVKGLKLYSGYLPFGPNEPFLEEVYDVCEKNGIPVIFHTGDTLLSSGHLKYSLPILIDDIATKHGRLKIVVSHFCNPWIMEVAELLYKNPNVLADVSGLVAGTSTKYTPRYIESLKRSIMDAISYVGKVEDKILFGSDWPVGGIDSSLRFVRSLELDKKEEELILGNNAQKLFGV